MFTRTRNGEVPLVKDTTSTILGEAAQAKINRSIRAAFLDLEKHCAWHGGYILDQIVMRREDTGWLCVLKAHRNGTAHAAFLNTDTLAEAYELLGEFASRGVLTWLPDKYPSKRLKRLLGRF